MNSSYVGSSSGTAESLSEVKEPSPGLLMSMAIRMDHGLGIPGYYDQPFFQVATNLTHQQRLDSMLRCMRQVWEEVAGCGFYSPDAEEDYAALAKATA